MRTSLAAISLLLIFSVGCSSPPPTTFNAINQQIFAHSCANFTVCHDKQGAKEANMLDLATDPYNALVNVPPFNDLANSQGLMRVKPGDPDHSFILIKLQLPLASTDDGGYQASMPSGNPHLPDFDISGIKTWIMNGAANN